LPSWNGGTPYRLTSPSSGSKPSVAPALNSMISVSSLPKASITRNLRDHCPYAVLTAPIISTKAANNIKNSLFVFFAFWKDKRLGFKFFNGILAPLYYTLKN